MSNEEKDKNTKRTPGEMRSIARTIAYREVQELKKTLEHEEHIRGRWLGFFSCLTGLLSIFWQWPEVFVPLSIIQGIFAIDHRAPLIGSIGLLTGLTGLFFLLSNLGYF
ncbi:MAG: hypothetical protein ACQEQC_05910 [Elusimicrobiota bacterium]